MREKKRLEWSHRAEQDTGEIFDFIIQDNASAAEEVVHLILETADALRDFPLMGKTGRGKTGTREIVLPRYPYTLVYRVYAKTIRIVTVLHESRLYP